MAYWLLTSGVQLGPGPEGGGVSGWIDDQYRPVCIYPEITGYYLSFLASLLADDSGYDQLAQERARAALDWLAGYASRRELPPTRRYLITAGSEPWYNAASFSFDLGMVARGVAAILPFLPDRRSRAVLDFILTELAAFEDVEDGLRPYHRLPSAPDETPIPERWSTMPGMFQLKVASGSCLFPIGSCPPALERALSRVHERWPDYQDQRPTIPLLHPWCYYLEGLVSFGILRGETACLQAAEQALEASIEPAVWRRYRPEAIRAGDVDLRADVLAQVLRVACILRANGYLSGFEWRSVLDDLASALAQFQTDDGGLTFRPPSAAAACQLSVWSTMFAYQALSFYDRLLCGMPIAGAQVTLLV